MNNPILPIGVINLKTGSSRYFNIYDTWGENTAYEIWKVGMSTNPDKKVFRIVATSGKTPIFEVGQEAIFHHDQTGRYLFTGQMIDFAVGSKLKDLVNRYGNLIRGYTYK